MNVSQFYAEIGRKLNDPDNQRWSQAVLLERMNRSQTKILALTKSVKTLETLTPVAATATVQLDTDTIDIIRVDIVRSDGDIFELHGYLRDQLAFLYPDWQQIEDGEPLAYWWDGTNQQINLVPAPDSANAITNGLRVWEIQKPSDMSAVSDVPFGSNSAMIPYHDAIVYDVVAECLSDQAEQSPESLAKSKFFRSGLMANPGEFEKAIMRINANFDAPTDIPPRLLWKPTGGRLTQGGRDRKAYPLG